MGQTDEVVHAVELSLAAQEVAVHAGFVQQMLETRAAAAAKEAGLTVRQFAQMTGKSKSDAGRLMQRAPMGYAFNPRFRPVVDELLATIDRLAAAAPAGVVILEGAERGRTAPAWHPEA